METMAPLHVAALTRGPSIFGSSLMAESPSSAVASNCVYLHSDVFVFTGYHASDTKS